MCLLALAAGAAGVWWYWTTTADARRAADLLVELREVTRLRPQEPGTVTRWLAALGWKQQRLLPGRYHGVIAPELVELGAAAVPDLLKMLTDPDWEARTIAAGLLASIGDRRAVEPLVRMMQWNTLIPSDGSMRGDARITEDGHARAAAAHALGVIGDSSVTEDLLTALGDESADVRGAAIWSLGQIGDPRTTWALLKHLGDANIPTIAFNGMNERLFGWTPFPTVYGFATTALDHMGPAAVPELIRALTSQDHTVRLNAARYLCYLTSDRERAEQHAYDPNPFDYLLSANRDERISQVAPSNLAAALVARTTAVGPLIDRLSDTNANVRGAAAWALGHFGDPRAESALRKLFADKAKAPRVFDEGHEFWPNTPFRGQLPWTDTLAKRVGHHAMIAVGRINGDRGVEVLSAAATDDDPRVRLIAVAAFDGVGGDRAVAVATRALYDRDRNVRYTAMNIFGGLSGSIVSNDAFEAVLTAAGTKDPAARAIAVRALAAFDHPKALATLNAAKNDPIPAVRTQAFNALHCRRQLPPKSMLRVSPE